MRLPTAGLGKEGRVECGGGEKGSERLASVIEQGGALPRNIGSCLCGENCSRPSCSRARDPVLFVLSHNGGAEKKLRCAICQGWGCPKLHASRAPRHVTTTETTATNYGAPDWTNYKETLTTYNIKGCLRGGQLGNGGNANTQLEYASRDIAQ